MQGEVLRIDADQLAKRLQGAFAQPLEYGGMHLTRINCSVLP